MKTTSESSYRFLAAEILRLVPCDRILFLTPLPERAGYRVAASHPERTVPAFTVPADGSCTAFVIGQRHGHLLSAIGEESHFAEEEPLYRAGIRDAAFVPLFLGGEALGAIIVGRMEVNSLEPRSVRCLEKISGLLAATLAANRDSTDDSAPPPAEAGSGVARIVSARSVDEACRFLLETIRRQGRFRRVILTLLDGDLQPYQWFFAGMSEAEVDDFHDHPPGPEVVQEIFRTASPGAGASERTGRAHVPIFGSRERPLGYLLLDDPEGTEARAAGIVLAQMLAALAGVVVERSQLQTELLMERSRLQKFQEQLVHSEKLSALGQMVSGVAHELNNPLSGVVGFAELALKAGADSKVEKNLHRIVKESQRCQRIVQNLLSFARRTKAERHPMNVNELIENVLDLRAHQFRLDNVKIKRGLARTLPRTLGDFHQIQQVLMNIVNNAHQAMLEVEGPRILTVRTAVENGRIAIQIGDTGPGISPSTLGRVFEPFYTTKPAGKGTGLGLSLSQGLVKEHGGEIRVESVVGKGTTFIVELPVHKIGEEVEPARPVLPSSLPCTARNILVVDDEEVIVDLLQEVLSTAGHHVEVARDGRQALDKILKVAYDAVITDLRMPGIDGVGLYDSVCRQKPEMAHRFVFSSGDLGSPSAQDFFKKTGCPCLTKPFDLEIVRDTLDHLFAQS